jgi:hypothetical protein
MPAALVKFNFLMVVLSLPFAVVRYISMNRGIRLEDLKMLNPSNFRKLFKEWMDIYKKY